MGAIYAYTNREPDWVELGCRGWHIDETGAGLVQCGDEVYAGDDSVCCDGDVAHLDLESRDIAIAGCPFFLRRVVDDMAAAGVLPAATASTVTASTALSTVTFPVRVVL